MKAEEYIVPLAIVAGVVLFAPSDKPEITAAHVKESTERKQDVRPEDRLAMRHPIALELCSATMGSGYHRHLMNRSKERCYMAKGNK